MLLAGKGKEDIQKEQVGGRGSVKLLMSDAK